MGLWYNVGTCLYTNKPLWRCCKSNLDACYTQPNMVPEGPEKNLQKKHPLLQNLISCLKGFHLPPFLPLSQYVCMHPFFCQFKTRTKMSKLYWVLTAMPYLVPPFFFSPLVLPTFLSSLQLLLILNVRG